MTASPTLDGRILRIQLDVTVRPPAGAKLGETDAAFEVGRKIASETQLLARRLAGEDCTVRLKRKITAY